MRIKDCPQANRKKFCGRYVLDEVLDALSLYRRIHDVPPDAVFIPTDQYISLVSVSYIEDNGGISKVSGVDIRPYDGDFLLLANRKFKLSLKESIV